MPPVGRNIKALREKAGMTQEAMAEILGISRPAVTEIERGSRKVSAEELVRLARAFQVSTDHILGLSHAAHVVLAGDKKRPRSAAVRPDVRVSVPQKNVAKFREVLL